MNDRKPVANPLEKVENVPDEELTSNQIPDIIREHITTIEKNKATIANFLGCAVVGAFVINILIILVAGICKAFQVNETTELLKEVATIFGSPLGFVFGYFYGVLKSK